MEKGYKNIPILLAVLSKDFKEVQQLISTDPTVVNAIHKKSGDSPLIVASRFKNLEIARLLLENGAHVQLKNLDGKRAIHEASGVGSLNILEELLRYGSDVDALKRADWTPLMFACANGHLDCATVLIKHGASINRVNKDGWSAFHLACREGHVNVLKYLLSVDFGTHLICSKNSRTPLHTGCMHGQANVCKLLTNLKNVDLRAKDSCGSTPALDSIRFNFIGIAAMLVAKSQDCLLDTDNLGKGAIHVAAQSGHCSALEYLVVECKHDIDQQCGNSQMSPLHYAAKEGNIEALKYIISLVDSVDCCDKFGRTPLHLAVASNKLDSVPLLISARANLTLKDNHGKCPADYAFNSQMKDLLFSYSNTFNT